MCKFVKSLLLSLVLLLSAGVYASAFDGQLSIDGQKLYLNGQGPRKQAFLTVYDTALYLTELGSDAKAILEADHPMAIRLVVRSRFATSERISAAFREGLEKSTGGKVEAIQPQTDAFLDNFESGVVKNDSFEFIYVPGEGTTVYKNGQASSPIDGLEFKKALFGIWLSDTPVASRLKSQLLGH